MLQTASVKVEKDSMIISNINARSTNTIMCLTDTNSRKADKIDMPIVLVTDSSYGSPWAPWHDSDT